jgi:CRP/FNR family transcriptional regulator, cyclic AMP receptor protein
MDRSIRRLPLTAVQLSITVRWASSTTRRAPSIPAVHRPAVPAVPAVRRLAVPARRQVGPTSRRRLVKQGHVGVGLFVILDGETKVVVGGRTRRRLGPGSFFGEISLLDRGPRTATVVAETPVRALSLSAWNFRAALKEHPSLAVKMLEELASRVRAANPSVSD